MALLLVESSSISSSFSGGATDSCSDPVSSSSTPPTTVADSASLHSHSDSPKQAEDVITVAVDAIDAPALVVDDASADADADADATPVASARGRRPRGNAPVYNLAQLSGTAGHGKRRSKGDIISTRRRTISGRPSQPRSGSARPKPAHDTIDALDLQRSLSRLNSSRAARQKPDPSRSTRLSSRLSSASAATPPSSGARRGRKGVAKGTPKLSRELRRLQDTKEFSHVDDKPVLYSVWANGKYVDPDAPEEHADDYEFEDVDQDEKHVEEDAEPVTNTRKRRVKKYLDKGLYAGQEAPLDIFKGLTSAEKKKLAQLPELLPTGRLNKTMPAPIFNGLRTLINGRDFKLPYHICNPLPPGQPKPDEWKKMTKNRFIGNSKDYWRKTPHFHDYQSKCVCRPEDGCGESCQNRIMLYECDEQNCNIGRPHCTNRAFADLTARRNRGGKFRVGVEVIKTSDRGYGVRSNRCFKPNQIIMEYAGEIITEEECERRMNEVYRDNECYYLMSFDQNMIIDATTGSIARFVNHSCNPNCRMIKWIVSGQPRMALFAGDKPIVTGDELTYDYNFDPFSAKNVQTCLCGEPNCRGVLGPKSREAKAQKTDLKGAVKATVKAGKRKLKELMGDGETESSQAKKRKVQPAKGVQRSLSNASAKVARGAATAFKRGMSTLSATAKKAALGSKLPAKRGATAGALLSKNASRRVIQTYGKTAASPRRRIMARASSVTIVAKGSEAPQAAKGRVRGGRRTVAAPRSSATGSEEAPPSPVQDSVLVRTSPEKLASPRTSAELPREADEILAVAG